MLSFFVSTASVCIQPGPLTRSVIRGLITPRSLRELFTNPATTESAMPRLADLADYTRAQVCMDLESIMAVEAASVQALPMALPVALLVSAEQLELAGNYSEIMAAKGFHIAAFTRSAEAERWAQRQANVRAFWLACAPPVESALQAANRAPGADRAARQFA